VAVAKQLSPVVVSMVYCRNFFNAELKGKIIIDGLDVKTASMRYISRRVESVF
jgi:hypothetical protein